MDKFWDEALKLVKYLAIALIIVFPIRVFVAQPFVVKGESMHPTFESGNYLIIDEITYKFREPHRGEVIVFKFPNDPKRFFIKRVIGLPGETLVFTKSSLTIKNKEFPGGFVLKEPYIASQDFQRSNTITLEKGEYFVMGDNRSQSSDSRFWGPLTEDFIIGRAWVRLWPPRDIDFKPGSIESFHLDMYEVPQ